MVFRSMKWAKSAITTVPGSCVELELFTGFVRSRGIKINPLALEMDI